MLLSSLLKLEHLHGQEFVNTPFPHSPDKCSRCKWPTSSPPWTWSWPSTTPSCSNSAQKNSQALQKKTKWKKMIGKSAFHQFLSCVGSLVSLSHTYGLRLSALSLSVIGGVLWPSQEGDIILDFKFVIQKLDFEFFPRIMKFLFFFELWLCEGRLKKLFPFEEYWEIVVLLVW